MIVLDGGARIEVDDVQAPVKGLSVHHGRLVDGTVTFGESGTATIDVDRRRAIARAHTATHLVHKALHESVGESATQAGSLNAPSRLRFDFRSPSATPSQVVAEIEARVNERLQDDLEVTDSVMQIDEARGKGAMALFGEKYGNEVRVVDIGDGWSLELCAGTHVKRSGELGLVTLLSESAIGSGVRRVDALVGAGAYGYQAKERALVGQLSGLLGARPDELSERVSVAAHQAQGLGEGARGAAAGDARWRRRARSRPARRRWGRPASSRTTRARSAATSCARSCSTSARGSGECVAGGRRDRWRQQGPPGRGRRDQRRGARARACARARSCGPRPASSAAAAAARTTWRRAAAPTRRGWPRPSRRSPTAVGG